MSDSRAHADAIVVYGASQWNGRPSPLLEDRLRHGLELYRAGVAPRIITVGGVGAGDIYSEGGVGASWLVDQGAPADAVIAVPTGRNTLQSARDVGRLMKTKGWSRAVVVTDRWHSLRAGTMLRDEGIATETSPVTVGPSVNGTINRQWYIARETLGYLYYRVTGSDQLRGPRVGG